MRFSRWLLVFVIAEALPLRAGVQATIYASPTGTGSAGSKDAPCSLTGARDLARMMNAKMTGDIVIQLRGGTYHLTAPLQLTESAATHDSGTNGFNIIYEAFPGETPVLSGGVEVSGWTLFDKTKNIYRAKVDRGLQTRQLYLDGERVPRARSEKPTGWVKTKTGFTTPDESMQTWKNQSDIEVVARSSWKHLRCGIASITGTTVTMKMPGWQNAGTSPNHGRPWSGAGTKQINDVSWIENAFELLQARQWYLDRSEGYLYYIPAVDQDMAKVTVVAPAIEKLLEVSGSDLDHKIHNVQFRGLTFEYGTWLLPSGDQGYADNQAGVVWVGQPSVSAKTMGNLSFQYATNIHLEKNVVAHMGGVAIDFGHGAQHNAVVGNCVYDISGGGIYFGEVDDYATTDPRVFTDGNVIQDNYITRIGAEYEDQVGIWVGYTKNLSLDHNEIVDTPYSGISVGWGWGKLGYSFKNSITNNFVHDTMKILNDGGGIYTLGNQGDANNLTVWSGNDLQTMNHGHGYYPDEGSGWMELKNNLLLDCKVGVWVHLWTPTIHDVTLHDNFTDNPKVINKGTNCPLTATTDVKADALPPAALAIQKDAGLEPAYADIKAQVPPPAWTTVDDTDAAITYTGDWKISPNAAAFDNGLHFTKADGDSATFTFDGSGYQLVTETYQDEGEVEISVDGALVKTIDCRTPARQMQQTVFEQGLAPGAHTLKVTKKSGEYMILDAIRVYRAPVPVGSP